MSGGEYPPRVLTPWVLTPLSTHPRSTYQQLLPEYPPPGTNHPRRDMVDQRYLPPPLCEQTDASENITFPQLRWRTVIISSEKATHHN